MPDPFTGPLLDRGEAAKRLHVSERTIRRLTAAGHLDEVRVSARTPRITVASVERHLRNSAQAGYQKAMSA
jgi:excisionase family DNA binding protein